MRWRSKTALLALVLICGQLFATTIVPMSVERLTRASTHVVIAQAADSWTEWDSGHTLIYTVTRFSVQRSLKGSAPETLVVKQLGGISGAYQQKVAGVRQFESGQQSVLFIHPAESNDGRYVVTGLMQGNFAVKSAGNDPLVSNGVDGVESLDLGTGKVKTYRGSAMRLSQLVERVRKADAQ